MYISTETAVTIVCAALTVGLAGDGLGSWRRGRRVISALSGFAAALCALIAMRDLPAPVVVALLLSGLGVVAVVTAWPLLVAAWFWARRAEAARRARTTAGPGGRR